jgi:uridylate kinase
MDATAISLCMDHRMPIIVFDVRDPANIGRIVRGESVGSLVTE